MKCIVEIKSSCPVQKKLFILYALLLPLCVINAQTKFNGNLEHLDDKGMVAGWNLFYEKENTYKVQLDSLIKKQGKYSISITSANGKDEYGAISYPINKTFHGSTLTLFGWIKTENVRDGFAGLWLKISGTENKLLTLENMDKSDIKGTNEWKEYSIQVPYDENEAVSINMGAWLNGKGKIWVDSFRLYSDNTAIDEAKLKPAPFFAGEKDTSFSKKSGIDTILITKQNTNYLNLLGQLWGFLKYHHPAVAKDNYNWDAELFRVMPVLIKCQTDNEASLVLESWVDKLGPVPACISCIPLSKVKNIAIEPDYGILFNNPVFSKSLISKLGKILQNRNTGYNYYISFSDGAANPKFKHENAYADMVYPDAGYRLLALYRYWNMTQYFFPSRNLITEGWNNILSPYIPALIHVKDQTEYAKTVQKLLASIYDTHATIGSSKILDNYKGDYRLPFQAKFIEGKLVVTGYYSDTNKVREKFKTGDIIVSVNGISVENLVKKYLPLSIASNYETKLRDMPSNYLLRSNIPTFNLKLLRNGKYLQRTLNAVKISSIDFFAYDWNRDANAPGYYLVTPQIGYIFSGRYKNKDLNDIKVKFSNTKGIIVDMRCYPSDEMENTFGNYIKPFSSAFVKFSKASPDYPGLFVYSEAIKNGEKSIDNYKGKVVIIVNEYSQSNAEFVTMAFQSNPNVTVIGSTTAGADGNISGITLPGDISTSISGLGVFYPDGTNTQRKGVKIDYTVKPSIRGIRAGRDELLEKAKQLINGSK